MWCWVKKTIKKRMVLLVLCGLSEVEQPITLKDAYPLPRIDESMATHGFPHETFALDTGKYR